MSPEVLVPKQNKEALTLENIDFGDVESVKEYVILAGDAVARKIIDDPNYLNNNNGIVDLAFRTVAVCFERVKSADGITGVADTDKQTINFYEKLMSAEAAISGRDSKNGALSLQSAISNGNLPIGEAPHIAQLLKNSNELIKKIFSDENVKVNDDILPYFVNNTIPIIESLKRQNQPIKYF